MNNKLFHTIGALTFPALLSAAPQFPQNQTDFENALSLPRQVMKTKSMNTKSYECVTIDPPRASILFDFDSDALKLNFHPVLTELVKALQNRLSDAAFTIEGHTDNVGTDEYNMELSMRRAKAVRQYLINNGIDAGRLSITGKGEQNPIADNATAQGRVDNRRVEIVRVSGVCN